MTVQNYQLSESYELLSKIIEFTPAAMLCLDGRGRILFGNESAWQLLGITEQSLIQQSFLTLLVNPTEQEQYRKIITKLKKTSLGEKTKKDVFLLKPNDNQEVPVEITFSVFKVEKKSYFVLLLQPADGQDNQLRNQHLSALGRLAANVASDFNNILTVIKGYAELMSFQLQDRDPFFKQVEAILKTTEYAENLTRQLLTFGYRGAETRETVDLTKVYFSMKDLITALLNSQIVLKEDIDQPLWLMKGDAEKLQQIFLNLIINACDAMKNGGRLTIRLKNQKLNKPQRVKLGLNTDSRNFILLQIEDTGKGMSEEIKQKVFEPYFTTDQNHRKKGLGLSVVYGSVKAMHGAIQIESEINRGTIFSIYFPAIRDKIKSEETKTMEIKGGKETILVVEDVPEVQVLLVELLQTVGYKVTGTSNYQEAMDYYQEHANEIDMIITDVVLPDNYGTELISKILEKRPDLKYLLISGYAEQLDIEHNISLFQGHFLQKPFQPDVLLNMVREMLDKE